MTGAKPRQWTWERPVMDAHTADRGHHTTPCDHVLIIYDDETDCDPGFWRFDDMPDEIAARIVCAWNAHEGMVDLLERVQANRYGDHDGLDAQELAVDIRAALALAKGDAP